MNVEPSCELRDPSGDDLGFCHTARNSRNATGGCPRGTSDTDKHLYVVERDPQSSLSKEAHMYAWLNLFLVMQRLSEAAHSCEPGPTLYSVMIG